MTSPQQPDNAVTPEMLERFWAMVDKRGPEECWPWIGGKHGDGYGMLSFGGKRWRATHIALWLKTGEWVPKGHYACHSCDNPPCVNPAHLWQGTPKDNAWDMIAKGRNFTDQPRYNQPFGIKHPHAKLNDDAVRDIRSSPLSNCQLGRKYGVTDVTILRVRHRLTWNHVEDAA